MSDEKIKKIYLEKIKQFIKHSKSYYLESKPTISDKEFDELKKSILERGIAPFLKNQYYNCDQPREEFLTTLELRKELEYPGQNELKKQSNHLRNWQINIATAMQRFINDYTFRAIERISSEFGSKRKNLCLSGGFFMNCVFNGK